MLAPNSEIATAIRDRVESHFMQSGLSIWPTPNVRDFASWAIEHYAQSSDALRILSPFESRELWYGAVSASKSGAELLDRHDAARAAQVARRAMQDYEISSGELRAAATDEARALLEWFDAFDAECRELRIVDPQELTAHLTAPHAPPLWIESPNWRPSILRWLQLHGAGSLPPQRAPAAIQPAIVVPAQNEAQEWATIAHWTRTQLTADSAFRAWIYLPAANSARAAIADAFDLELVPARFSLAREQSRSSYAIAGGVPLSTYAPVRSALEMLEAITDPMPFEQFSALLRAPELTLDARDGALAAALDVAIRVRTHERAPLSAFLEHCRREAARRNMELCASYSRLTGMLQQFAPGARTASMSDWVARAVAALEHGPWAERAHWSSRNFQAARRFCELLHALARADRIFGPLPLQRAVSLIARAARDTPFQPQTGVPPIWITAQPQDPWLTYDAIWVAQAEGQAWPPGPRPLALLPIGLQRAHGVPMADRNLQAQRAADFQRRWCERTAVIAFSFARHAQIESRVSTLVPADARQVSIDDSSFAQGWRLLAPQATLVDAGLDAAPAMSAADRTRGIASITEQSLCAFRGFAHTRLRADPLELPEPGFNARQRGSLVHDAMLRIWLTLESQEALRARGWDWVRALVERAVAEALTAQVRKRDPGVLWQAREKRRLVPLLMSWLALEDRREPFNIEALERETQIELEGVEFNFRIDRIDRLADGGILIIDYKSGHTTKDWEGERARSFQLPVYALAANAPLAGIAYAQLKPGAVRFCGAAANAAIFRTGTGAVPFENDASAQTMLGLWSARAGAVAGALKLGKAGIDPLRGACRDCRFSMICRAKVFDD